MLKVTEVEVAEDLLKVENLAVSFRKYQTHLQEGFEQVLTGADIAVKEGEIVAVVGASGSGKSILASAILGILPDHAVVSGRIDFKGQALTAKQQKIWRGKEIAWIPQSIQALDPLMKTGRQAQAVIKSGDKRTRQQRVFRKLGLSDEAGYCYPFQLSGGMARKALVSTAILSEAKLIIADEPTSGMDSETLHEFLYMLKNLAQEGRGVLVITHDLEAALAIADRVAVFYGGQTLEIANASDFAAQGELLRHPYTKALWNALPQNDFMLYSITESQRASKEGGCVFQENCPAANPLCTNKQPRLKQLKDGMVRCFHA